MALTSRNGSTLVLMSMIWIKDVLPCEQTSLPEIKRGLPMANLNKKITFSPLVRRTQQVENGLDRVEGCGWNFDKEGMPAGHAAIPQAGQFQDAVILVPLMLGSDDHGIVIDEAGQVIRSALPVAHTADHVHRIEMGRV